VRDVKDCALMGAYLGLKHPKYKLLWDIGVDTGLRISDIIPLRVKQVVNGIIEITERKTGKQTVKALKTQINDNLRSYINRFGLRRCDFLFFPRNETRAGKHIHRNTAYKVIKCVSRQLELEGLGTHSMRKTHALNRFRETQDVSKVQEALNHKYPSTTMGYLISSKDIKNLLEGIL
jgi:integrase